jgi:hypothetical protein
MTHTLHRAGKEESLQRDFVLTMMPSKGINVKGSAVKLKRLLDICMKEGAVKVGDARLGNQYHQGSLETMLANIEDQAVVQAVFDDAEKVTRVLRAFREADTGMSVVVSGLHDKVDQCCREAGLKRHTVNQSLGRWGLTEKLPPEEILELNTMCGHGMVAVGLIEEIAGRIRTGELTPEEGAEELFKPCMCGIFNTARAAGLLKAMSGS